MARDMYLRFVYPRSVDGIRSREGFFQAAAALANDPMTDPGVSARVDEIRIWFATHLDKPGRFSRTKPKGYGYEETRGLSWFKPSARDHIAKAFELKAILDEFGYPSEVLKEERVGYIVYEDDHQIVAEPFADTRA